MTVNSEFPSAHQPLLNLILPAKNAGKSASGSIFKLIRILGYDMGHGQAAPSTFSFIQLFSMIRLVSHFMKVLVLFVNASV